MLIVCAFSGGATRKATQSARFATRFVVFILKRDVFNAGLNLWYQELLFLIRTLSQGTQHLPMCFIMEVLAH